MLSYMKDFHNEIDRICELSETSSSREILILELLQKTVLIGLFDSDAAVKILNYKLESKLIR
jgi:hypothetical protein